MTIVAVCVDNKTYAEWNKDAKDVLKKRVKSSLDDLLS